MTAICLPIDASAGSPQFPAAQHRAAQAALIAGRTDRSLGSVSGFRPGGEPAVSVNSVQWTVGICNGVVDPGTAQTVGPFLVAIIAAETGAMNAADGTFQRIDRLDLQVPDDPAGASPLAAVVKYTAGIAASSPSAPAAPSRSTPIGTILVDVAGGSGPVFTPTWNWTVASGGILPVRPGARPSAPYVGQKIYDSVAGELLWNGTAWKPSIAPRCQIYTGSAASIPNDVTFHKLIGWNAGLTSLGVNVDTIGISGSSGDLTMPAGSSGTYEFSALIAVADGGSMTGMAAQLQVNGAVIYSNTEAKGASSIVTTKMPATEITLNAGDVFNIWVRSYGGSSTVQNNVTVSGCPSWFRLKRIA